MDCPPSPRLMKAFAAPVKDSSPKEIPLETLEQIRRKVGAAHLGFALPTAPFSSGRDGL